MTDDLTENGMEKQTYTDFIDFNAERMDKLNINGWEIRQNAKLFCFGIDAVLLRGFHRLTELLTFAAAAELFRFCTLPAGICKRLPQSNILITFVLSCVKQHSLTVVKTV